MITDKTYLSQEKYNTLKQELESLTTTRRKEIAEKLEYAKSLGDLSENAEYQEAREDQALTEERIAKVELLLRNAEIVSTIKSDLITFGSKVTIKKESTNTEETYEIVGEEEADISNKKISNRSPIGVAIMGKKKGDQVVAKTPSGEIQYTIVNVE
ncbi:transcription elongation factor GreA [candidate division KSB1 bacterium]|nr:transcription elongation factor GreA [candidate division KSB1 bacterium]